MILFGTRATARSILDIHLRAAGFEWSFWNGAYPKEDIHTIVELMQVMNTAPRGSLEFEDERFTPE